MASIVQLKRSALSGKVPDTGSLNLGELAVNTYDGKIYFKKSGSIESVESVVTTNSVVTGSIRLEGTGSFGSLKVNDTLTVNHGVSVISGSLGITSDLTVLGQINARQFNIAIISSSTLFESGSSNFGNSSDDTHTFTGSVNITGSFLLNGQEVGGGTTTGSFTGSFTGDGSGLRGVVSDDIPRDGWDYNANSSASISDFNSVSDKYYIDFEQSQSTAVGTPVGFKGFMTNVSGSTQILPTLNSIDFIVRDTLVASIGVGGIVATAPAGTVSGSSQLTSSYDTRYVLSGSITQTTWDNIASKPSGIVSGSSQLTSSVLATTGSNLFVGTQTHSGSIIPATDNTYDLGSPTYQWRDIYVSSGSLYIDGTKVLSSTNQELQITTDEGQSIKILEAGSDSIILQSADGDIQLKTSGGGNLLFDPTTGLIDVRGTLQIQDGNKITSSGGNSIIFGNDIGITGSITTTGNVNGINLTTFSSSIASTLSNQNSTTSSYETKGRGIVSGSSQITYADISSIPSGIVSGSSQITISSTTGFTTYSSSVDSRITTEKGRVDAILLASDADKDSFAEIVSLINSVDTSNDSTFASFYTASVNRLNNLETTSGSVNTSVSNLNTFSGSALTRLSALEVETSNLETFTSSINTTIKTRLNAETVVSGSSQVTLSSTTGYGSVLNQAVLTTSSPTFAAGTFNGDISIGSGQNANIRMGRNANDWGEVQYSGGVTSLINGWANTSAYVQQQVNGQWTRLFGTGQIDQNRTSEGTFYRGLMNGNSRFTIGTDGSANVQIRTGNSVGLRLGVNEDAISIANGGNVTFSGTITENSSIRYKENVETIKYGLDKVLQMRGVTYDKKDNGVRETGVIAEEIYEVLPEVVLKNEEGDIDSVSYGRIVGVLIEAIKEQQKQIEELKSLIK
jgi:hypothetical protein